MMMRISIVEAKTESSVFGSEEIAALPEHRQTSETHDRL
jgi:hypothetical protein